MGALGNRACKMAMAIAGSVGILAAAVVLCHVGLGLFMNAGNRYEPGYSVGSYQEVREVVRDLPGVRFFELPAFLDSSDASFYVSQSRSTGELTGYAVGWSARDVENVGDAPCSVSLNCFRDGRAGVYVFSEDEQEHQVEVRGTLVRVCAWQERRGETHSPPMECRVAEFEADGFLYRVRMDWRDAVSSGGEAAIESMLLAPIRSVIDQRGSGDE